MTNVRATVRTSVRSATPATVLRLALALVFLGAGCGKVLGVPPAVALFHMLPFGEWFRYAVGTFELVGAVMLTIPVMARRAALGLVALMVGAAGTEVLVLHRPPILSLLTLIALIVVARGRTAPRTLGLIGALAGAVLGALTGVVAPHTAGAQPSGQPQSTQSPSGRPPSGQADSGHADSGQAQAGQQAGQQSGQPQSASTSAPADSVAPPRAPSLPPAGSYDYVLAPDSSDDVRGAVNRTVEPMSFITRPIARGRLNATNPTPQHVQVSVVADTLGVAFDGGTPVVTPLGGATVPWQSSLTHETYQVHATVAGDTVSQHIAAPDGVRQNAYLFMDGGQRLKLRVTVTSHRLPGPLVYDLLFRRTPGG
jgi:uncharacterized membrane protein